MELWDAYLGPADNNCAVAFAGSDFEGEIAAAVVPAIGRVVAAASVDTDPVAAVDFGIAALEGSSSGPPTAQLREEDSGSEYSLELVLGPLHS